MSNLQGTCPEQNTGSVPLIPQVAKLPEYADTILPPTAWIHPFTEPARLASQSWGVGMASKYESWPELVRALDKAKCFGVIVKPSDLAKSFWLRRQSDGKVMNLAEWPDTTSLLDEDGHPMVVYYFQARSQKSPSWFQWGLRGPNNAFLGYPVQIGQSGSLTVWNAPSLESMAGGRLEVYGFVTRLHTDTPGSMAEPGSKWAWLREWYSGENDYSGSRQKGDPEPEWFEVSAGQLPVDTADPGGEWPQQALKPNLASQNGVPFEDANWQPTKAKRSPEVRPSQTDNPEPTEKEGVVSWSSDEPGNMKQVTVQIHDAPNWCRHTHHARVKITLIQDNPPTAGK